MKSTKKVRTKLATASMHSVGATLSLQTKVQITRKTKKKTRTMTLPTKQQHLSSPQKLVRKSETVTIRQRICCPRGSQTFWLQPGKSTEFVKDSTIGELFAMLECCSHTRKDCVFSTTHKTLNALVYSASTTTRATGTNNEDTNTSFSSARQ
jgi:hypothetical protein